MADEKELWGRSNEQLFQDRMNEQADTLEGSKNAVLWSVSRKDGKKLAEQKLDFLPAFDGMIAANGKLFIVSSTGKIVCYK